MATIIDTGILKVPMHFFIGSFHMTLKLESGVQRVLPKQQDLCFSRKHQINCGLWHPRAPYLNLCYYYLRGTLKGRVCMNNPHSSQELDDNIWRGIDNISRQELRYVSKNTFRKCEACLEAGGQHFETLQWYKVSLIAGEELTINFCWMQASYTVKLLHQLLCGGAWFRLLSSIKITLRV